MILWSESSDFFIGQLKCSIKSPDINAPMNTSGFSLKGSGKYYNFPSFIFNLITIK